MTKNGDKNMKVDAVRNLNVVHNYNFGAKEKTDKEGRISSHRDSSIMTKVPVIVLLAMNPATLSSAIPVMPETDNPNNIVMLAPEQKSVDKNTYVIAPELQDIQQINPPYGWEHFRFGKIQHSSNVVVDGKYNPSGDYKSGDDIIKYVLTRGNGQNVLKEGTKIKVVKILDKYGNAIVEAPEYGKILLGND